MPAVRRTPWTTQPQQAVQIDRSTRFGAALQQCLLPSVGLRDIVSGETWGSFGTAPALAAGPRGESYKTPAANSGGLLLQPSRNIATAAQTHLLVARLGTVPQPYGGIVCTALGDGSAGSIAFQDGGGGTLDIFSSSQGVGSLSTSVALGLCVIVLTGDSSGSVCYVNGASVATAAAPTTHANSRIVLLGERVATTTYASQGEVFLYAGAPMRVTASEARALSANPWQLFAPLTRFLPGAAAPSGIPTLSAATAIDITATSARPRVTLTF